MYGPGAVVSRTAFAPALLDISIKEQNGLIIVDLTKTEPRMLERYQGKAGARMFLAHHEALNGERNKTCA